MSYFFINYKFSGLVVKYMCTHNAIGGDLVACS